MILERTICSMGCCHVEGRGNREWRCSMQIRTKHRHLDDVILELLEPCPLFLDLLQTQFQNFKPNLQTPNHQPHAHPPPTTTISLNQVLNIQYPILPYPCNPSPAPPPPPTPKSARYSCPPPPPRFPPITSSPFTKSLKTNAPHPSPSPSNPLACSIQV